MKICHYMDGIWDTGGIAININRVATAQRALGHEVVYIDPTGRYANEPDPNRRPITVAPERLAAESRKLGIDVLHLHSNVDPWPFGGPPAVRTVHEHRPYCPSGERYLKRSAVPCDRVYGPLTCLQGHLWERCGTIRPWGMAANFAAIRHELRTLRGVPVIAISEYVKEQMIRTGYGGENIHVLLNPAPNPRPFGPPIRDGVPRFLFLSRLAIHKGLQWILRSVSKVGREIAIDVAGKGPQRPEMEALAASLGLSDSVKFHGWVDEVGIDALCAASRAMMFTAVWHEPAGLATFDASARGRAVIASISGGIPEYALEGQNALLVPPNDDEALASAIRRLVDDPGLAQQLGEGGHALASGRYSLSRHITDLHALYDSMGR